MDWADQEDLFMETVVACDPYGRSPDALRALLAGEDYTRKNDEDLHFKNLDLLCEFADSCRYYNEDEIVCNEGDRQACPVYNRRKRLTECRARETFKEEHTPKRLLEMGLGEET